MSWLNIGFQHFGSLQWTAVLWTVSYLYFLYTAFFTERPWDWMTWVILFSGGFLTLAFFAMTEWPGRAGFAERSEDEPGASPR